MILKRCKKERKFLMIQIPEKTIPAFHSQTILSLNTQKVRTAKSSQTICTVYKLCFSICRHSTRMERKKNRLRCGCLCIFIRSKSKSLRRFLVCFLRSATKPWSICFIWNAFNQSMRKNSYSAKSVKFRCAKNRICINYKRSTYKKFKFQYDWTCVYPDYRF